jgi:hypothetical protein
MRNRALQPLPALSPIRPARRWPGSSWNQPGRDLGGSNFGIATGAGDPRIIQFGMKLIF